MSRLFLGDMVEVGAIGTCLRIKVSKSYMYMMLGQAARASTRRGARAGSARPLDFFKVHLFRFFGGKCE